MAPPMHPVHGRAFDSGNRGPGRSGVHQFGLVEPIDRLSHRIVVTVSDTTHAGFHSGLGQVIGVANPDVLAASIAVVNQVVQRPVLGRAQGVFQRFQNQRFGTHCGPGRPPHDSTGEHVGNERRVAKPRGDSHVPDIRDPQSDGRGSGETPLDQIRRVYRAPPQARWWTDNDLVSPRSTQPHASHGRTDRDTDH